MPMSKLPCWGIWLCWMLPVYPAGKLAGGCTGNSKIKCFQAREPMLILQCTNFLQSEAVFVSSAKPESIVRTYKKVPYSCGGKALVSKNRMMHGTVVRCYHDGIIWYNVLSLDEKDSLTTVECAANIDIQHSIQQHIALLLFIFDLLGCSIGGLLDCQPPMTSRKMTIAKGSSLDNNLLQEFCCNVSDSGMPVLKQIGKHTGIATLPSLPQLWSPTVWNCLKAFQQPWHWSWWKQIPETAKCKVLVLFYAEATINTKVQCKSVQFKDILVYRTN